eukprot:3086735-Rhodomonas_salina.5
MLSFARPCYHATSVSKSSHPRQNAGSSHPWPRTVQTATSSCAWPCLRTHVSVDHLFIDHLFIDT